MNFQDEINAKTVLKIIQSGVTNKALIAQNAGLNRTELQWLIRSRPKLQDQLEYERKKQEAQRMEEDIIDGMKYQAKHGRINLLTLSDSAGITHRQLINALDCSAVIRDAYAKLSK
jgi:hypothetical protein